MTTSVGTGKPKAKVARGGPALGANLTPGGVAFALWAPDARSIDVEIGDMRVSLERGDGGVFAGVVPAIGAGVRYRYRIDGGQSFPDPYSRSQPEGPHGPSEVVDPHAYAWHDGDWPGVSARGLVVYELHVGTYTPSGTFDALIEELDALVALGVTAIELMPVASFPGQRGWGYDGVDLFAPHAPYGGPEGLRRLVDAAHARGLGIILDVVYNHFGPDGNYLTQYARSYFTDRHTTAWGDAVNFDAPGCEGVRRFVIDNARSWVREFHIDGLRLDATFAIKDDSRPHILQEVTTAARAAAGEREIVLIAETYENDARYVLPPAQGGLGFDAVWADDFHHVVHTMSSHEHAGYYGDYDGSLEELARTINRGWLFEGQRSSHFGDERGTRSDGLPATAFVYCTQNHDQVGNRAFGRRFSHLAGTATERPWSALLLLLPYTPMLFMGQEFSATSRFYYFTDHVADLGAAVTRGRRTEFAQSLGFDEPRQFRQIPDPQDPRTFAESRLNLNERYEGVGAQTYRMCARLLALRKVDPVLRAQDREDMRAVVCGDLLLVHSWQGREQRLIVVNTGLAVDASPLALGLPAELTRLRWDVVFSSDARSFGGNDDRVRLDEDFVSMPPYATAFLAATAPGTVTAASGIWRRLARLLRR